MRWTGICWSCSALLIFHSVLAELEIPLLPQSTLIAARPRRYNERPETWPRVGGQKKLTGMIYETTTTIYESETTIYEPKITQAPLLKRKLGSNKWDLIHEGIQGQKRDAASCPSDYQLCPQSMNGGCCPNDRVCGTSSCLAATAAPASACGKLGYVACGISEGGGCCPSDYVCGKGGCTPSAGVSFTETCGVSSYLCPASLGYGCCKNGMGCGISNCYSTEIVSLTLTETKTTTDDGAVQTLTSTLTTAITPEAPTALATTGQSGVVPKVTSPPEPEIAKTKPSKTSSGGLTRPQLGGIIGGAVALLIAILIAALFILRRLHKVKVIVEASRSSSGPNSRTPHARPLMSPEIDALSNDPFLMTPSDASPSMRQVLNPIQPPSLHSSHHEVEASSPPVLQNPWSPRSPPFTQYNFNTGYAPVATSDSSSGYRHPSLDSTPGGGVHPSPTSYFDMSPHTDLRDQNLRFGHTPQVPGRRPSKHERQWSQSSEVSQFSQPSSDPAELDASENEDRRSSFQKTVQGMTRLMSRRKSSTATISSSRRGSAAEPVLTGGPVRPDWNANPMGMGLGHIPEAGESRLNIEEISPALEPGLTNAQLRELTLMERETYKRKGQQERMYSVQTLDGIHPNMPGQGEQLLRDVDLGG